MSHAQEPEMKVRKDYVRQKKASLISRGRNCLVRAVLNA